MFSYQMVIVDLNKLFENTSLLRTASYEAMVNAQDGKEELCQYKMGDIDTIVKDLSKQLLELKRKIELIKDQS